MAKNIGGLWIKKTKNGDAFYSGVIEINGQKHKFACFKNNFKDTESKPDFVILPPKDNREPVGFSDVEGERSSVPPTQYAGPNPIRMAREHRWDGTAGVPF